MTSKLQGSSESKHIPAQKLLEMKREKELDDFIENMKIR